MGRTTIEWTSSCRPDGTVVPGYSFNPWLGCTKISPGCAHCYAENLMDTRWKRVTWGRGNPRQRTSETNWKQPLVWDREAKEAGERRRVFCASLADVFDPEAPDQWRSDLFSLIEQTENLDWLLLTKRPELVIEQFGIWQNINPEAARSIWFGISAEDQERIDERADYLTDIRLAENITFVSAEPLLGDINLASYLDYVDWVICGEESGPGARPMKKYWVQTLLRQCRCHGIPFFFKQWGGVNKKAAGNVLDGRQWLEVPA
jgi:protein gp37